MKPWIIMLFGAALCLAPVRADEDDARDRRKDDADKKKVDEVDAKSSVKDKSGSDDKKDKPSPIKRLVELRLDPFLIPARQLNIPLPGRTQTVRDLMDRFESLGKDEEIGAVLLNLDGLMLALPDVEELRAGVAELRKRGKKVVAYLNEGDPMGYLLACAAEEIAVAPSGALAIPGVGRLFPFMRGRFQMQGLEFDVITAGKYKYPGFLNRREPDACFQEEFDCILDSWFKDYIDVIAQGRNLSPDKVREAIDVALFDAQDSKNRGLVDEIAYYEEYRDRVLRRFKFKKSEDEGSDFAQITSLNDLLNAWSRQIRRAQESYKAVGPKIAILHARGPIVDFDLGGTFSSALIMRDRFVKTIEEIRKNKTVRAVVLRIDSPGGSGYASDVIWRKLRELDEEKPLVVSMGTVAGSGGYYIACPARLIFAEPTTITGSIGVLAILGNQASALNRMDVNLAEMMRGRRSLLGVGHRDLLPQDRDFIQKLILDFYEIFLDRVAATRKMPKAEVRKIAEGRVYTGRDALKINLVDRLGGLADAIAAAREMADIPPSAEIRLVHYPRPSSIGEAVESFLGVGAAMRMMEQAQRPAAVFSFDSQVRYFAQRPRPLCWMALPDVRELLAAPSAAMRPDLFHAPPTLDLMDLLAAPPAQPMGP